jgi:hypothetical protein
VRVTVAGSARKAVLPRGPRSFLFKIELQPLSPVRAALAWRRYFGAGPPDALRTVETLTPGGFAVVARTLRGAKARCAASILDRLASEAAWKPPGAGRIGFV